MATSSKIPEHRPASIREYVQTIEQHRNTLGGQLWYRGASNSAYNLAPSIYRHPKARISSEYEKLEKDLISRFRQRSIPFLASSPDNLWDTLFLMQHHRVPTRLLDWTENPFIALFFALINAPHKVRPNGSVQYTQDAAVWLLRPEHWNKLSFNTHIFDREIPLPSDTEVASYSPAGSFLAMREYPIAIYGSHNNPRIVAQRGVFTVFGHSAEAMDQLAVNSKFIGASDTPLIKLIIGKRYINRIRSTLADYGFTDSVVFPDLEGLAAEMRRQFEFEV